MTGASQTPDDFDALFDQALALVNEGQCDEALAVFDRMVELAPANLDAHNNRGVVLLRLLRPQEAQAAFERAIVIAPDLAAPHDNRGVALHAQMRLREAVDSFQRAAKLSPGQPGPLCNRGLALRDLGLHQEALAAFDQALALRPNHAGALAGRAAALVELRRHDEALAAYDRLAAIQPADPGVQFNRGVAFQDLGRHGEALASYDRALVLKPGYAAALTNRGVTLMSLTRYAEALESFERAMTLDPAVANPLNGAANCAARLCDWERRRLYGAELETRVRRGDSGVSPFVALGYIADPALLRACNERYSTEKCPAQPSLLSAGVPNRRERIRLAYLSSDFHDHATARLAAGLFERHDRSRFEVIAISFGPPSEHEMARRLTSAFDQCHDVRTTSDHDVATLIRDLGVDIAVDLKGHTQGARPAILSHRPAPIQVAWLGYPSTLGASFLDYVIADPIVLPFDQQPNWSEQIVHLPGSYQVNDDSRPLPSPAPSRAEAGLPDEGLVFCSFNNSWKFTPEVFDVWMRLLDQTSGSVLWLYADSPATGDNLRLEASRRGIDRGRLVFAAPVSAEAHLARQKLADLFLDTLPCNAHTTASDALWAGLPVLTCPGTAFPGRVAASVLTAAGLPELIAANLEDYEAIALTLAHDPRALSALKAKIADTRATCALFDTPRFTRNLEAAYEVMHATAQRGEAPRSFAV